MQLCATASFWNWKNFPLSDCFLVFFFFFVFLWYFFSYSSSSLSSCSFATELVDSFAVFLVFVKKIRYVKSFERRLDATGLRDRQSRFLLANCWRGSITGKHVCKKHVIWKTSGKWMRGKGSRRQVLSISLHAACCVSGLRLRLRIHPGPIHKFCADRMFFTPRNSKEQLLCFD